MADMTDILALVRSGRLAEATQAIQDGLAGQSPAQDRPMKDVTPTARALPGPDAPAGPAKARGKATRPRRAAKAPDNGRWLRRDGPVPYRLSLPEVASDDAPLIVMLHGCTQTPEDFAAGTCMAALAGAAGGHVIWPQQTRAGNPNACWSWFEPAHQGRGGEAAAIAAVIETVRAEVGGTRRVHVAGLSAGAAMAAILGATRSDLVASVGLHSGLPVGCARDVASAFGAMRSGGQARMPLAVPAIVLQGTVDATVAPANAAATLAGADRAATRMAGEGRRRATVTTFTRAGQADSEVWMIDGLGHAWSGGDARGSFADPAGPDASAEMLRFFAAVDAGRR